MEINIENLVRANIKNMVPYSSARHEYSGRAEIFLDANENPFGSPLDKKYNRYPDPLQQRLKEKLGTIKGVPPKNIFIGSGSDEAIDLLCRVFCEPGRDNILVFPPTYGMYEVCAAVNNVTVKKQSLTENFELDIDAIEEAIDPFTKIIFICSPNNPTGNSMRRNDIEIILNNFDGLVVIDEAYINYARQKTFIPELTEYPNLVVLQTLSKAWGLAGLRIGMAFASAQVIGYMNKIKYPYNISTATQELAMEALDELRTVNDWIQLTVEERERISDELNELDYVEKVFPSDANFVLVKMKDAIAVHQFLSKKGIIVRDRSNVALCENCLRITVGTPDENKILVEALASFKNENIT
jgi:histidinol-phosphate aminotransferase